MKEFLSTKDWIFDSELGQHRNRRKANYKDNQKEPPKFTIESNVLSSCRREISLEELLEYPSQKVKMFATIIAEEMEKLDHEFLFQELHKPLSLVRAFRAS